jgi:hypothetical protein
MMKNKLHFNILLLGLILLFSPFIISGYGATDNPELPQWQVGDWWKFNIEISGEANLIGTYTFTIVNEGVDVFQNKQNFNCYQIDASGEGTLSGVIDGNEIEGTWAITELQYYTKSDQSWVAFNSTFQETFSVMDDGSGATKVLLVQNEKNTSTITIETMYNPPFKANKGFPLTVGGSWSAETTETTKTQITADWNFESITETKTYTKTFSVLRKELITLPIGETETYVVKMTDPDGAYSEAYYSPEVGFDVKQIDYSSTGTVQTTLELLDYNYSATEENTQLLTTETLLILLILTIMAVTVIMVIFLLKMRRTDTDSQIDDELSPVEF